MDRTTMECRKASTPAERAEKIGFNYHADCWVCILEGGSMRLSEEEASSMIDEDPGLSELIKLDEDSGEFAGMSFRQFFS